MRPYIGVTCSAEADGTPVIRPAYVKAVHRAGGLPVALPFLSGTDEAHALLDSLHGVVLTGSEDLDPALWGEALHPAVTLMHPARQATELALGRALLEREHPVLAICGGMQNLVVAAGGSIHQHLPDLGRHLLDHAAGVEGPRHAVTASGDSLLRELLGAAFEVNSAHHQGVANPGDGVRPVAHAPDGVLEAWELPGRLFGLGVQWHPEQMPDDDRQQSLFRTLVAAAAG